MKNIVKTLIYKAFKTKQYYLQMHKDLYEKCIEDAKKETKSVPDALIERANQLYDELATADHIVGYYLFWYQEQALTMWLDNLAGAKEKRKSPETAKEKEVSWILNKLYGTSVSC